MTPRPTPRGTFTVTLPDGTTAEAATRRELESWYRDEMARRVAEREAS